ncbi:hypothetical protein GGX14DRAFT_601837 [Mycena pura]|uniref:F-box domain-containing protein n=1 Tax=Mycena pura TaxID=153505 RepID=A0AAD6YFG5_9AGAR|nr:hypothetical protein GGX14DRAFT_601837 [Mycena pura]
MAGCVRDTIRGINSADSEARDAPERNIDRASTRYRFEYATNDVDQELARRISCSHSEADALERPLSVDPASMLPTEIVCDIFVHVLPVYPICPPLAGKSSPTQLTHVCRKWREIALSTPSLWRAIRIRLCRDKSWDLDFVQTWLRRSGSCPLSLRMDEPPKLAVWAATRVFEMIVPHRARWEYLSLYLRNWCNDLLEIAGPMPLLRGMKVDASCGSWNICTHSTSLPTVFCEVPHLRSMTFVEYTFPSIGFPWSQLTSLRLISIDVGDCTKLFQQTVNLVHCKVCPIDSGGPGVHYGTIEPDTRLPRLESLDLVQEDGPYVMEYLGTFIVPALLRLQVSEDEYDPDRFFHLLSAFIAKAGCKLQELRITGSSGSHTHLYRWKLASIPRLFYNDMSLDEEYGTSSNEDDEERSYSNRDRSETV